MKLIVLILANDTEYYIQMQAMWKLYMNKHPDIRCYFLKYNPLLQNDIEIDNNTIFIKGNESLIPGCLEKTIKSIEYLLLHDSFDFIFRTNMSSVIDLNKLYNILNNEMNAAGVIGYCNNQPFISGAGILLNKQICEKIIEHKHLLEYNIIDDVSIGHFLTQNNIPMSQLTRFEMYNYEHNIESVNNTLIEHYYHFRCKSNINTTNTIRMMLKVINLIYNINV